MAEKRIEHEVKKVWNDAHAAGKLAAAQHIIHLWEEPWPVSQMSFISRLRAYVASCEDDVGTT